ncbi:MAG: hypothetical protein KDK97_12235, partial [Verrucomicrobiales bacterium]|nr:hypothetical protein [Verrucomicrobiales bacterium]
PALDYGDYPAFAAATQTASTDLKIGIAATDPEPVNPATGSAIADDTTGIDDEDLTMPTVLLGGSTKLTVPVTANAAALVGGTARLQVFVDWNGDADLTGTNETLPAQTVNANGTFYFNLTPPPGTMVGTKYLRVRITEGSTAPGFGGLSSLQGEVEDYAISVTDPLAMAACFKLVVGNLNSNTIAQYDGATGNFLGILASGSPINSPSDLLALPDGNLLATMSGGQNSIEKFNPENGAYAGNFAPSGSGGLNSPASSLISPDGYVYVASYSSDSVIRYNVGTGATAGAFVDAADGVSGPLGIALDLSGNLYVANGNTGAIKKYDSAGVLQSTVFTYPAGELPRGMTFGTDGNLYVIVNTFTPGIGGRVDKITLPTGTRTTFLTMDADSMPAQGILWGPDGNLYVNDYLENEVQVYSATGSVVRSISTGLDGPCGIAIVPCLESDFGDLPAPYGTVFARNGARHYMSNPLRMGVSVDGEADGLPTSNADGDDTDSDGDDEDGVTFGTIMADTTATVIVNCSGDGRVNAFFDWNADGDFFDGGESIAQLNVVAGNNTLLVPVPAGAATGTPIGARFRISTAGGLSSIGGAVDGEVEDYLVNVVPPADFGDYPVFPTASQGVSADLHIGTALTDAEPSSPTTGNADADDTEGRDDEDIFFPTLLAGVPSSIEIPVTMAGAVTTGRIKVFVDWNGDGDVNDSGESLPVQSVTGSGTKTFVLTPPSGVSPGIKYARVRLTEGSAQPAFGGVSPLIGEVEDYAVAVVAAVSVGNVVWVDTNNDGIHQAGESGVPNLRMELWKTGDNGVAENGGGDDVPGAADEYTNLNGEYLFHDLPEGSYYVRIPEPPVFYPATTVGVVSLDNNVNDDNNGMQPGGPGTPIVSPVVSLIPGDEPGAAADGDDSDKDSTVDFGLANADPCYANNLFDNPSFEFGGSTNVTGVMTQALGYDSLGTSFGVDVNALKWTGGVNGTSGLGEPIQRVQVFAVDSGAKVSWVESFRARHGRRFLLMQGTGSSVSLRAAGGGNWSSVLQAGKEYEVSVWADTASTTPASLNFDLGANAQIVQALGGLTPGRYQFYTATQGEMDGIPEQSFQPIDFNGWNESSASSAVPDWHQYRWRFRIMPNATQAQIDSFTFMLSGGDATGPIALDYVYLCEAPLSDTLAIGNVVWNDINKNGRRDVGELGVGNVDISLYTSADTIAGNADDVLIASTTTSPQGQYLFNSLSPGRYALRVTPTSAFPSTGGTPVTADNGVDDDNNGSQPGGPGTTIFSPVITLGHGLESTVDGDIDPDSDQTQDFGLFSGIHLGDLVFADDNNNGAREAGEPGISGVKVELLDDSNNVITSTTTNGSGNYSFNIYQPGSYRLRIPASEFTVGGSLAGRPLASSVADAADNGEDNDSNALQAAGVGTVVTSPLITLTAGGEPGSSGLSNTENTVDFGFRACPTIAVNPGTMAGATQYTAYSVNLTSTGGSGPYTYGLETGSLPSGITLSTAGVLGGTPGASAAPGNYAFSVRSVDSLGCSAVINYTLTLVCPPLAISPSSLAPGAQYAAYSQALSVNGGTSPYTWTAGPVTSANLAYLWPAEGSPSSATNTAHGNTVGTVTYAPGKVGKGFSFNGGNNAVRLPDNIFPFPTQTPFSFEVWFKTSTSGVILGQQGGQAFGSPAGWVPG